MDHWDKVARIIESDSGEFMMRTVLDIVLNSANLDPAERLEIANLKMLSPKESGYRVSPFEVEWVLSGHPAVHECTVTGINLEEDKTITTAFVVLKEGNRLEKLKQELLDYTHLRLAKYKCPSEIVFLQPLPKTLNGKIKHKRPSRKL